MRAYGNGISGVSSGVSKWPTQRRTTVRRRTHKLTPRAWDDEINCTLTSNQTAGLAVGRRHCSLSVALLALTQISTSGVACAESQVLDTKMVGSYLPKSKTEDGFYEFTASKSRTPALRAGALEQYQVNLPAEWKEVLVSNAKSGNYCQPRCDEATTEVSFGNSEQGTLQVIIIPTTKLLIAKKNPSLKDVGSATGILNAISPAITGSVAIEEEDIVDVKEVEKQGKVYYEYELFTPYAQSGAHNLTTVCTSMNYLVMATISATEKEWTNAEKTLKAILRSFSVGGSYD